MQDVPKLMDQTLSLTYRIFLEKVLPELLDNVPFAFQSAMWFQHDGAPARFCITVRNNHNAMFAPRWIGLNGPVAWPVL
ncbi:hypothetical protein AVEN_42884-1 [Araneus ventricosus]|uniref:Uncharacterized protein n=1 Tax=Araneus ventricosus TaxID=182803 RepID=A0A4Y2AEV8_ARAVE|nr:hypothetical protein AVEN_42884-1 [Araneus ventricosus]